jgi:hypothetical protein
VAVNVVGAQFRRGAGFAATVKERCADVGLTPERWSSR